MVNMHEDLEHSIFKTLVYFDLFNYPLTSEELYHFLWQPPTQINYNGFVEFLHVTGYTLLKIEEKNGFYFLKGRSVILENRHTHTLETEKKMKIAKRGISKLRWVPFIKSVFVCNTVAGGYPTQQSDIDVFIIVQNGRLWLARFFSTLLLKLFRLRTSASQERDKICLSFYISENNLDVSNLCIENPDIYLAYWLAQLVPVYDPDNIYRLIKLKNVWIDTVLPHAFGEYQLMEKWKVKNSMVSLFFKKLGEKFWGTQYGNLIEAQTKKIQLPKVMTHYGAYAQEHNSNVIIEDTILKFHKNDRREEYRARWLKHLST